MRAAATGIFLAGAAAIVGLILFLPLGTAFVEALGTGDWQGAALGPRRLALLGRGLRIAIEGATVAQAIGAGFAAGLVCGGRVRIAAGMACAIVLLTPPYLNAYSFSLLLIPGGVATAIEFDSGWHEFLTTEGRAVWCLATWLAPIAALILAGGWLAAGRPAARLATLDASPWPAFLAAALPVLAPWIAVSILVTFALAVTEYSVCHLCLVQTWNTEILGELQQSRETGRALLLAWPLVGVLALIALALWPLRDVLTALLRAGGALAGASVDNGHGGARPARTGMTLAAVASFACLAPLAIFACQMKHAGALAHTWTTYSPEWPAAIGSALASAAAAAWIAIAVDFLLSQRELRGEPRTVIQSVGAVVARIAVGVALFSALAPPALVGDAFAAAYAGMATVANHWPIVAFVSAARFAVIAMLVLRLGSGSSETVLCNMATLDGADAAQAYFRIRLPLVAGRFAGTTLVVALLSFTEVAATSLVRPPGVGSVALTLLNMIHFGRNDDVIAMALYVVGGLAMIVTVATLARGGR